MGAHKNFLILCCLLTLSSCALLWGEDKDKSDNEKIKNVEIQEDVHRVATKIIARVSQNLERLHGDDPKMTEFAIQRELLYDSSVISIASQSMPEVSLLDMMVFLRLSADVLENHWIPNAFVPFNKRNVGIDLLEGFHNAIAGITLSARKIMSEEQIETIWRLADRWLERNPNQDRVEQIRFSTFAQTAGKISEADDIDIGGIMGSIREALSTADEAILMSNRIMFLTQRFPFLLRLHARLATGEIISSAANQVETVNALSSQMTALRPLVNDVSTLTTNAQGLVEEGQELIKIFRKNFPEKAGDSKKQESASPEELLSSANQLMENTLTLLREFKETGTGSIDGMLNTAQSSVRDLIWQIALAALVVGAGLAFFWWGGYLLVKRYLISKS